jgi:hypothetical protein
VLPEAAFSLLLPGGANGFLLEQMNTKKIKKAHVYHNGGNNEWYTPKKYIDSARKAMGTIDVDPASTDIANKTVLANIYYDINQNGLKQNWIGNVWMNPPYSQPLIADFCLKLKSEIVCGNTKQACVLVNNATETKWFKILISVSSAICFPSGRIKFVDPSGNYGSAPLQGQSILYSGINIKRFVFNFKNYGFCARINHE